MIYIFLLLGFVLLIKGADWLVKGATAVASRFGVSDLIIGLTIVSMGTSLPELIISIIASAKGSSGLAIGNVLGSNIANILLILGVTAIICDLPGLCCMNPSLPGPCYPIGGSGPTLA